MGKKLRVGLIGMGCRGISLLEYTFLPMTEDRLEIVGVCDVYEDRRERAAARVEKACGYRPISTADYREVLKLDIDAVIIMSSWVTHIEMAIAAMKAGKYVGMEVGGAYSVEDCWRLVHTSEETGVPCMLLENCCYGKRELMVLNMVKQGVFGEVVHCEGGYHHDLRPEIAGGEVNRHYRLQEYLNRNCENYPTHELGPIAKILKINNGNRMLSLTSTASCAKGMHAYLQQQTGPVTKYADAIFAQGDVVNTVIRCAGGETISITLDTTLPRAYSRGFTVRGTSAAYFEDMDCIFQDGVHRKYEFDARPLWGNAEQYEEQYLHPLWRGFDPTGGHDGMDEMVFSAFIDAASAGVQPPIDVYDAAAWMSITALSAASISTGSMPVEIPDFTSGRWIARKDIVEQKYSLTY